MPVFKWLQWFNLSLIHGRLQEGCNERCMLAFLLHIPSAAIPLLRSAGCSWPCQQGLHLSSPSLGVFQDQTPSPELLQPLIFLHDFQYWMLLWVLGGRGATGPPRSPPHPTLGAQSCSGPIADPGDFSFSLMFALCPSPCTATHSHIAKEKEAERLPSIRNILSLIWSPMGNERRYWNSGGGHWMFQLAATLKIPSVRINLSNERSKVVIKAQSKQSWGYKSHLVQSDSINFSLEPNSPNWTKPITKLSSFWSCSRLDSGLAAPLRGCDLSPLTLNWLPGWLHVAASS